MCVCNTWSSAALSLPALLLALSLSSDVDIHGTKLIPNSILTLGPTNLLFPLAVAGKEELPVFPDTGVVSLVLSLSRSLSLSDMTPDNLFSQCLCVKPDTMQELPWACGSASALHTVGNHLPVVSSSCQKRCPELWFHKNIPRACRQH